MWKCMHCKIEFGFETRNQKANHSRWCVCNPKSASYRTQASEQRILYNKTREYNISDETKHKLSISAKKAHKEGKCGFKGKRHSKESIEKISIAARKSDHRRLVKSCRKYVTVSGEVVLLDSSWEESLAVRLDEIMVEWIRPLVPIMWIDAKGNSRKYFPDFYLPAFGIFLDPKNPEAVRQQNEKVMWLKNNRNDVLFITSLQECKDYTPI